MKVVVFADLHLGVTTYGELDPSTGLNTRVLNALASLDALVKYVLDNDIKIVAFVGDAYKNALPSRTLSHEFDKRIKALSDANVRLLLLDGNHDVSRMAQTKSPTAHLGHLALPNVTHTRFYQVEDVTLGQETVRFVFLPTYHTAEEIEAYVDQTATDYPVVFLFHGTLQGSLLNDWNVADREIYVDPEVFDQPGVAAVAMGHLHKPQVINTKPLIFYTGSLQRVDFSEEHQLKGFVILTVNPDATATREFHEIPSQPFVTLSHQVTTSVDATTDVLDYVQQQAIPPDAVVRLHVDLPDRTQVLDDRLIQTTLYSMGASYVLDLKRRYPVISRVRIDALNGGLSEADALRLYFKDHKLAKQRIARGLRLIDELQGEGLL